MWCAAAAIGCSCDDAEAEADALIDDYGACDAGDLCEAVDMVELLGKVDTAPFSCFEGVRKGSVDRAFGRRAEEAVSDNDCFEPIDFGDCSDPFIGDEVQKPSFVCNEDTRRCEVRQESWGG